LLKVRSSKVFYGWWIVGAGFFNQAVASALLQRSYGAYVVLLRDEFGWSKAALSGAFSLQQVENGILGPVQGWLIGDRDSRRPRFRLRKRSTSGPSPRKQPAPCSPILL
jgi:hypothetical protein